MKKAFNFIVGTVSSYASYAGVESTEIIQQSTEKDVTQSAIALISGIFSTLLINILKAKFPSLFKPKNRK